MRRLAVLSVVGLLFLGCKDDARGTESTEPAAVEGSAPAPNDAAPKDPAPLDAEPEPAPEPASPSSVADSAVDPGLTIDETPTAVPAAAARNLGAELRAAVGTPIDCVKDFQPSSARTIRIDVRGVVRPTGMIIEPSASGGGLSRNDLRCIEERVGTIVLSPLGSEVSEPVSTAIELDYTPPEVESFEVAPPPPPPENVVQALPKKDPIAPSGQPIEGPDAKPIEGPSGEPIEGPEAVPIKGPAPVPIGSR